MTGASVALAGRIEQFSAFSAALEASCWNRWGFAGACCRLLARHRVSCGNSRRKKVGRALHGAGAEVDRAARRPYGNVMA